MPRTLSALSHELVGLGSDCVAASGASGVVLILCRMSRVAKAFQMAVARRGDLHLFWLALRVVETRDVADRCGPLQELHAVVALERSLVTIANHAVSCVRPTTAGASTDGRWGDMHGSAWCS